MALPVTIPNEFANATASIPLSQLDTNFTTLANAVNGISDGSETLANASVTVLTAGTANVTTLNTSGQVVFNDAGADVDFRVEGDTEANLLFVDASTDRVGIGTSSPSKKLNLEGVANNDGILLSSSADTDTAYIFFGDTSSTTVGRIAYDHAEDRMEFFTGGAQNVVIDDSGNVGIGTDDPAAKVHIFGLNQNFLTSRNSVPPSSSAGLGGYEFGGYSTGTTTVAAASISGLAGGAWTSISTPSQMLFYTTPSGTTTPEERIRIDDSGNVGINDSNPQTLLHLTKNNNGTVGAAPNNILRFEDTDTVIGTNGQPLGRIDFYTNDSSSVGVAAYIEAQSSTGGNGSLIFATGLGGAPTTRLSIDDDGIKFNGDTAAANALDDYEEGTWTPVIADATSGGNTGSASISNATYVKIGKLVTIQATLTNIVTIGMTAANPLYVRGMPFTSASDNFTTGSVLADNITFQVGRTSMIVVCGGSDSWILFYVIGSATTDTAVDVGDISSGVADISFSITYEV